MASSIREWRDINSAVFRNEIVAGEQPAVIRGLVKDWPAVRAGRNSPRALCDYLKRFDAGRNLHRANFLSEEGRSQSQPCGKREPHTS